MDTETLLWNIGGAVVGILSALGTLYLLKVTENLFSRMKKPNQNAKKDEKE